MFPYSQLYEFRIYKKVCVDSLDSEKEINLSLEIMTGLEAKDFSVLI
jgi:hypothetical protein